MLAGVYEFVILWSLCGPLFDVFLPTVGLTDFHDLRDTPCGYSLTVERVYIHHEISAKLSRRIVIDFHLFLRTCLPSSHSYSS